MRRVTVTSLLVTGCAFVLAWQPICAVEKLRIEMNCDGYVVPENKAMGFSAEQDESCLGDNAQCFEQTCRLCKAIENGHTKHYSHCADIKSKRKAAQIKPASTGDSKKKKTNPKLKSMEAAMATPTSAECAARVSPGDQGAGITAIYDASCASGGLGCLPDSCKFCRASTVSASQTYKLCSELTGVASTASVTTTTTVTTSGCTAAVSNSRMQDVSFVTEPQCQMNAQLAGCVAASSCRLCRDAKNENNQFLVSCKVLREQTTPVTTVMSSAATAYSSLEKDNGSLDVTAVGLGTAVGLVLAMAAVAIKNSKKRRIADTATGDHLQRVDSIFQAVGRDRIAHL